MNLDTIVKQVMELAVETGSYILNQRQSFSLQQAEKKGLNDFVSYVDKESESRLVKGLSGILPDSGFIVEENSASHANEEFIWIVDPLDGTTNFIHGVAPFAISIALQQKNETILGVIYEMGQKEIFYSWKGIPVYCNHRPVEVSKLNDGTLGMVATGFPINRFERLDNHLNVINEVIRKSHGVRRHGSAATDLAYVAAGRFEGFFEYGLSPWDVAAGSFLVEQAGGKVSDYQGLAGYLYGKEMLAACPAVYSRLLEILKKRM